MVLFVPVPDLWSNQPTWVTLHQLFIHERYINLFKAPEFVKTLDRIRGGGQGLPVMSVIRVPIPSDTLSY